MQIYEQQLLQNCYIQIVVAVVTTILVYSLTYTAWIGLLSRGCATIKLACVSQTILENQPEVNIEAISSYSNPNDECLRQIIAKPRLTFHYFFRDLWKYQTAATGKMNLNTVALEASRKWNHMSHAERSYYKDLLEKRLQWEGIQSNPNRISMSQLINSQ